MTEKVLRVRDAKRDIGAELLQSVRDLKAGRWGRKTTIETLPDCKGHGASSCLAAVTDRRYSRDNRANVFANIHDPYI